MFAALLAFRGCKAQAQTSPGTHPTTVATDPTIDAALQGLYDAGKDLRTFSAVFTSTTGDPSIGDDPSVRPGKLWLQINPDGTTLFHAILDGKKVGHKSFPDDKIEYALDGAKLTDRDYKEPKKQITRTILRPGEKMNLLKLGEGPFPIPIGQKPDDVRTNFEVKLVPQKPDDPTDTMHLQLTTKPDTSLAKKIKTMDVWVANQGHLPKRIELLNPNENELQTIELSEIKINPDLKPEDLKLTEIDLTGWTRQDE